MNAAPQAETSDANKGVILIIDEDPHLYELVHYHFSRLGYGVEPCRSLDDWYALDPQDYSLILIDIAIENGSGLHIIDMLNQSPASAKIPVIICTQSGSPADIVSGLNAGADDFVSRPFAIKEMIARINALLRRRSR